MSIPGRQLVEIRFERNQQKMRGGGKGLFTGFRQNREVVEICSSIGWVGFGKKMEHPIRQAPIQSRTNLEGSSFLEEFAFEM